MGSYVRGLVWCGTQGAALSVQPADDSLINAVVRAMELELDTRHHWGPMSVTE